MTRLRIVASGLLMAALYAPVASGQQRSFQIRVIDGKSGKPLPNQRLLIFGGKSEKDVEFKNQTFETTTAADGTAVITIGPTTEWIQVWVDRFRLCQDKPNFHAFSVVSILETGENTPNNCGATRLRPTPGVFTVFAKNPSFLEKMEW